MIDFFNTLLYPIKLGEAWVMYGWHWLFEKLGLNGDLAGWAWALSIVGLTVVVRILLIPLFVRQIHSSRRMQLIQPEMQKIQKKYKGKRDPESQKAQQAEIMDLYRRTGTNPFSSCLPILHPEPLLLRALPAAQQPQGAGRGQGTRRSGRSPKRSPSRSRARRSSAPSCRTRFVTSTHAQRPRSSAAVLIVLMSATTFTTQYQLMRKNMPAAALDNPFAKQQKVLLYLMPIFFAISGINFPIGVLIYWLTTNVWTMGQQFYVIRNMPAPGSRGRGDGGARLERKGKTMHELDGAGTRDGRRDGPGRRAQVRPAAAAQGQEAREGLWRWAAACVRRNRCCEGRAFEGRSRRRFRTREEAAESEEALIGEGPHLAREPSSVVAPHSSETSRQEPIQT